MVNIAVLGYGTVGSGVVEVIRTNHESINKRAEEEINIKYVLDRRDFPGDPVEDVLVQHPVIVRRLDGGRLLFLDHQENAGGQQRGTDELDGQMCGLGEADDGEQNRQDGAGLVDGDDLVHVTKGECLKIAQPGRTGRQSGQHQKQQRAGRDGRERGQGTDDQNHNPRENQNNQRADGGCDIGIGMFDAAFG